MIWLVGVNKHGWGFWQLRNLDEVNTGGAVPSSRRVPECCFTSSAQCRVKEIFDGHILHPFSKHPSQERAAFRNVALRAALNAGSKKYLMVTYSIHSPNIPARSAPRSGMLLYEQRSMPGQRNI